MLDTWYGVNIKIMKEQPRIGDIVTFQSPDQEDGPSTGIVLRVRTRRDGMWTAAELLVDDEVCWMRRGSISRIVGRPKGISRIDQESTRTHGWYVRLYEEGKVVQARLFSDKKHTGTGPALRAALDFHRAAQEKQEQHSNGTNHPVSSNQE